MLDLVLWPTQMCLNIGQNWLNYFVPLPVTEVTEVTEVMPHWKELIDRGLHMQDPTVLTVLTEVTPHRKELIDYIISGGYCTRTQMNICRTYRGNRGNATYERVD